MIAEATLYFAVVALGLHLLTDARKLVQGLRLSHRSKYHPPRAVETYCPRCTEIGGLAKEAWWQVLAMVALVAHLSADFAGWGP